MENREFSTLTIGAAYDTSSKKQWQFRWAWAAVRSAGCSLSQIVKQTGVSLGTAQRALADLPKTVSKFVSASPEKSAATLAA
jgi:lambda repressor-like predicted transcriptional regulator